MHHARHQVDDSDDEQYGNDERGGWADVSRKKYLTSFGVQHISNKHQQLFPFVITFPVYSRTRFFRGGEAFKQIVINDYECSYAWRAVKKDWPDKACVSIKGISLLQNLRLNNKDRSVLMLYNLIQEKITVALTRWNYQHLLPSLDECVCVQMYVRTVRKRNDKFTDSPSLLMFD